MMEKVECETDLVQTQQQDNEERLIQRHLLWILKTIIDLVQRFLIPHTRSNVHS